MSLSALDVSSQRVSALSAGVRGVEGAEGSEGALVVLVVTALLAISQSLMPGLVSVLQHLVSVVGGNDPLRLVAVLTLGLWVMT